MSDIETISSQEIREKAVFSTDGIGSLVVLVAASIASIWGMIAAFEANLWFGLFMLLIVVIVTFCFVGLRLVNPNEGLVLQFFGRYSGTLRTPGLRWVNPFYTHRRVSLRVRNFDGSVLKVNDHDGNPIEVSAVVVWKVVDTAEAIFMVDDYVHFVKVQSEAALRNLVTQYPYDSVNEETVALRSHTNVIAEKLRDEVAARLSQAGVEVTEARMNHLAYAPEIAGAMLQRQQASAIIDARTKIVEGAVSMVEMALDRLSEREVINLDEERKATMIQNLLVVLVGERGTQPVLNTGSIYN